MSLRIDNSFRTVTQVRLFSVADVSLNPVVTVIGSGIERKFIYDSTDTTSADNTGTILVTSSGARYKIAEREVYELAWFDNTDAGFQAFLTACDSRIGIINRSQTLTTTMNVGSTRLIQRRGTQITTSAAIGFRSNLKKLATFDDLVFRTTSTTSNTCLWELDGTWNFTFRGCEFTASTSTPDFIRIKSGLYGGSLYWGNYYTKFVDCKFELGRYGFTGGGNNSSISYFTTLTVQNCWHTSPVSMVNLSYGETLTFLHSGCDLATSYAINLTNMSNCYFVFQEVTTTGANVVNQVGCNRNIFAATNEVQDLTGNTELLGLTTKWLTLQGSNADADLFNTKLQSVYSYAGSTKLLGRGGSAAWTTLLNWSETIGLELQAGYSNWLRLKENRLSRGASNQKLTLIKSMSLTSSQYAELLYFNLTANSNNLQADITVNYRTNDNTSVAVIKLLAMSALSSGGALVYSMNVVDQANAGTQNIPVFSTYYGGSGGLFSVNMQNIALAATVDIEVNYTSSGANAVIS